MSAPPPPRRLLFIGNSFTARNDLPGLITRLAAAHGHAVETALISAGGASLRRHWNAGKAWDAIERGGHDAVVLQEQSTLPIKSAARMHESVRLFDAAITAAGARTVLYMTWAKRSAPGSQAALTEGYTAIGKELGAVIVPVGAAWESFLATHARPDLYDKDGSHPSPAGTYLAACVFLATLWGVRVEKDAQDVPGCTPDEQRRLAKSAWENRGTTQT